MLNIALLIPCFQPTDKLIEVVRELTTSSETKNFFVLVIDDGSTENLNFFSALSKNVTLLRHQSNLGKGAAIKTGVRYLIERSLDVDFIVTIDSDGQHQFQDILKVIAEISAQPNYDLIIGSRHFDMTNAPLRSYIGNKLTNFLFKLIHSFQIQDTQSGLRAYSKKTFSTLLQINNNRYDYELGVLIELVENSFKVNQIQIATIYYENNKNSRFNVLFDSMRIYYLLLRHVVSSALSAVFDFCIYTLLNNFGFTLINAHFTARFLASILNFKINRQVVFKSNENIYFSILKYLLLVIISGLLTYQLITLMISYLNMNSSTSKIAAELILFVFNFYIQKVFIFKKK